MEFLTALFPLAVAFAIVMFAMSIRSLRRHLSAHDKHLMSHDKRLYTHDEVITCYCGDPDDAGRPGIIANMQELTDDHHRRLLNIEETLWQRGKPFNNQRRG